MTQNDFPSIPVLETGFDLDLLRQSGVYCANQPEHGPVPGAFFMTVFAGPLEGTFRCLQLACDLSNGYEYARTLTVSGWSTWNSMSGANSFGGTAKLAWDATRDVLQFTDATAARSGPIWEVPASATNEVPLVFGWTKSGAIANPSGGGNYYDDGAFWGWNWDGPGAVKVAGKAAVGSVLEYRWAYQPLGRPSWTYGAEYHVVSILTTDGALRRPMSFWLPHDGGLGSQGGVSVDYFTITDYGSYSAGSLTLTTGMAYDVKNKIVAWAGGTVHTFAQNNVSVFRQMNAAGGAMLELPKIDGNNSLLISQPMHIQATRNANGSAIKLQLLGTWNNGDSALSFEAPAVTTFYATNVNGSVSGTLQNYLLNLHASGGSGHLLAAVGGAMAYKTWRYGGDYTKYWSSGMDTDDNWKLATSNGFTANQVRLSADRNGNVVIGNAALATNATDGFLHVPSSAGAPTGTPTAYTGRVPIEVDTTNGRIYAYYGGAWHYAALT